MKTNIWPVYFPCPRCQKDMTVLELLASSTGEMQYDCICITCGMDKIFQTTWEQIIQQCYQNDLEKEMKETKVV